jgi:hypothetical protein
MFKTAIRAIVLMLIAIATLSAQGAELWVSRDGDDANSGTSQSPLRSVADAQRRARELRRRADPSIQDGVRIIVRGGLYPLTTPLFFRSEDSGTSASPTVIEAAPGERPILSGGVVVGNWRKLQEKVAGLPAAAEGNVWISDAPTWGGRMLEFRQLWINGRKAIRARTPNGETCERLTAWDPRKEEAGFSVGVISALREPLRMEMILQQQWEIAILRIKTLRLDAEQTRVTFQQPESQIEFQHPWPQPILPPRGGGAFFLANAIEFLDHPGEWYQEMPSGRVIYWPREGEDLTRDHVVVPSLETLVQISGSLDRPVSYVSFKGIGFEHSAWTKPSEAGHVPLQAGMRLIDAYRISPRGTPDSTGLDNQAWIERLPAAVTVSGAHHIRFDRCRFEHLAAAGLDFISGTHDDVIEGCVLRDIGGNGIQMGSFQEGGIETHIPYGPSDQREICTNERIANNFMTDCANEDWGCVGIGVGYAREINIEHNEVANVSYTGISLGWGWTRTKNCMRDNKVHANLLHHIATRMCDTAGVYTLSAQPGTVVSENYIHSIKMSPYVDRPDHWFYLYTDEGSSLITVRDNWCPAEKFLQNANGPGNVWENNGPMVSEQVKNAAGLEAGFKDVLADSK